jgi:hypothetical protein
MGQKTKLVTASILVMNNVTNKHEISGKIYPANKPVSKFSEDQPTVREYMFTFSDKQSIRVVIQQQHTNQPEFTAVSLQSMKEAF